MQMALDLVYFWVNSNKSMASVTVAKTFFCNMLEKIPVSTPIRLVIMHTKTGFFLYTPKKTETEKLSFFKKLRLKIEKKLKTEPKKLRSLEALCSGHSPKNSDYWRPYLVT